LKIGDLLNTGRPLLSFEFFPPKNPERDHILHETVNALRRFEPDFVSVTYGAGGTTRDRTLHWTLDIKDQHDLDVMMHLTCIASSNEDIKGIVAALETAGVRNILALRGDPPGDPPPGEIRKDFRYAYELVEYLKSLNDFSIGVAGYPEGHIEAESLDKDIGFLKRKVDAGADFIITQIFFDNRYFFDFIDKAESNGISVPIIPGIMPIVNLGQVQRFTQMCGATVPSGIVKQMEGRGAAETLQIGVDYAVEQCIELMNAKIPGLHFYTLNRNQATELILNQIANLLQRKP
jgi:methylenetetrahydrofolate reductase (NADPH)